MTGKNKKVKGSKITYARTLGSMYDNNSISVYVKDKEYRIKAMDLLPLLNSVDFVEEKARTHTYLKPAGFSLLSYDELRQHTNCKIELNDVTDFQTNKEIAVEIRCVDCENSEPLLTLDNLN